MDYEKLYNEALKRAKGICNVPDQDDITIARMEYLFPELKESKDEKIRKALVRFHKSTIDVDGIKGEDILSWLEKQKSVCEIVERCKNSWYNEGKIAGQFEGITDDEKYQQGWHDALETWKDMRLEVYQQASGNRHEPNYSDNSTKMFSLNDIDEIFENISEKQGEQKRANNIEDIVEIFVHDEKAYTNPGAFENSLGRLLKLFEKLPKQDLLDGLKFYANVVEHDGEYVKPTEWSEEDERLRNSCIEHIEEELEEIGKDKFGHSEIISDLKESCRERINWLKSLKERLS